MKTRFLNKKLEKLYTTGKSRAYKLPERVLMEFVDTVNYIDAAKDIHDFWRQPSLKFEKLRGFKRRYSFRLSRKYRLEVEIEWENEEQTIGIVGIDELSNHYR